MSVQASGAARAAISEPARGPAAGGGLRALWGDRPVAVKISAVALLACIGMLVIAAVSLSHLSEMRDSGHAMHERGMEPVIALGEVRRA